ncbi:hypothetical protein RFZ48_09080, partial [Acinetobacter baumannii]|nr:hypothetical protein [Acinetobacter baumannii]
NYQREDLNEVISKGEKNFNEKETFTFFKNLLFKYNHISNDKSLQNYFNNMTSDTIAKILMNLREFNKADNSKLIEIVNQNQDVIFLIID